MLQNDKIRKINEIWTLVDFGEAVGASSVALVDGSYWSYWRARRALWRLPAASAATHMDC